MQGVLHNYRRSRHAQTTNQMVLIVDGVTTRDQAKTLVGKTVRFSTGKKTISGEVRGPHGNKGAVRVLFETGMPGQALGQLVELA